MCQFSLVSGSNLSAALHPPHNECFLSVHYSYFFFPWVAYLLALIFKCPCYCDSVILSATHFNPGLLFSYHIVTLCKHHYLVLS